MSLPIRMKSFEDEDDDLESLRLAALKSLTNKKESTTSPINRGNAIEVVENVALPINNLQSARNSKFLSNFNTHCQLEQIDVTEPYIPQKVSRSWEPQANYIRYVPNSIHSKPNIIPTLSPRSLAFVAENNDILMRRKGEKSPRSPSPLPYREDSLRWSESPPPLSSIKRSPILKKGRCSRSPLYRRSPRRSISRTPSPHYTKSPILRSPKRAAKSPIRSRGNTKLRSLSRSPLNSKYNKRSNSKSPRRHISPMRNTHLPRLKSYSPFRHTNTNSNKWNNYERSPVRNLRYVKSSRSPSPKINRKSYSPVSLNRMQRKRSRSPYPNTAPKRSRSRSPNRKIRRSRERSTTYKKAFIVKSNEYNRKHLNRNQYNNRQHNYSSNTKTHKSDIKNRDISPPKSPIKQRSKSKSPQSTISTDKAKHNKSITSDEKLEIHKEKLSNVKTEQELEDELLASTDDDKNSTDDENNDQDEIDLFASEESESENEGRFKSSNKNENKVITVLSFSKLGSSSSTAIGELKDVNSQSYLEKSNSSVYTRRHERDNRDRDRKYERNSHRNESWKTKSTRDRTRDSENSNRVNKKIEKSNCTQSSSTTLGNNMKMFRSTFQAVEENEPKSSKILLSTTAKKLEDDKPVTKTVASEIFSEKRSVLQLKRPISSIKDIKGDIERCSTEISSTTGNDSSTTTKKPIHLRLGAITGSSRSQNGKTGTGWKSKKNWRSEKV